MSYAKLLYQLPAERLHEIMRRRSATLRAIPRIESKRDLSAFLASALSSPDSIAAALLDTDLLQMRVLVYAITHGGDVPLDRMVAEAGEAARPRIEAAAHELETNGLAILTPVNPPQNAAGTATIPRSLFVSAAVVQAVPLPRTLQHRLPDALGGYDANTVQAIYRALNLPSGAATAKAARMDAIADELTDPARLRAHIEALSEGARKMLRYVLSLGGTASLSQLASRLDTRQRNQLYTYDWNRRWANGPPRNAVDELLQHGILVQEGAVGWGYGAVLIPGNLLQALTGRSVLASAPELPDWQTLPEEGAAVHRHETLCRDIAYLLGFLGRTEAGRTAKGLIHRNVLKNVAKGLTIPSQSYAEFLYALCREADLIAPQGRNDLYDITGQGLAWLDQTHAEQLRSVYEVWRSQTAYSEIAEEPLVEGGRFYYSEETRLYRSRVITLLSDLSRERPGQLASLDSLLARAQYRWWSLFPSPPPTADTGLDWIAPAPEPTKAAPRPQRSRRRYYEDEEEEDQGPEAERAARTALVLIACASLYWLGLTEVVYTSGGEPADVALSPRGREMLLGEPRPASAAPSTVDTFIVQPNLEIYAPPNLAPRLLYRLFRIADPTASAASGMLTLSKDTLRRAFDRGEAAERALKFLKEHSQTGVPQNVEYLIREVGGKHGHIRVGQAGIYLKVDDPMLLKELRAQKKLNIHFRQDLADTVALVTGDSVDAILRQLRQAGYLPVADGPAAQSGQVKPAPEPARPRQLYTPPKQTRVAASEADGRVDWEKVAAQDGLPWDSTPAVGAARTGARQTGTDIARTISDALRSRQVLAIRYQPDPKSANAPAPEREIEPSGLAGSLLRAWDRDRNEFVLLNTRYITSAEPTGETFENR